MPFIRSGTAVSVGSARMCRHSAGWGGAEGLRGAHGEGPLSLTKVP